MINYSNEITNKNSNTAYNNYYNAQSRNIDSNSNERSKLYPSRNISYSNTSGDIKIHFDQVEHNNSRPTVTESHQPVRYSKFSNPNNYSATEVRNAFKRELTERQVKARKAVNEITSSPENSYSEKYYRKNNIPFNEPSKIKSGFNKIGTNVKRIVDFPFDNNYSNKTYENNVNKTNTDSKSRYYNYKSAALYGLYSHSKK
jgi:hypothetical protein